MIAPAEEADHGRAADDGADGGAAHGGGSGSAGYRETSPSPALGDRVACLWWMTVPRSGPSPVAHAVLPDGAVDLVWHAERLTVAGPDTKSRLAPTSPGTAVGVRLRPGAATTFGESAAALRDRQPSAEELWGADGRRLAERVADASGPRARLQLLAAAVGRRVRDAPPTDPVVDGAVAALLRRGTTRSESYGPVGVAGIAKEVGVSERQLRRRFHDHVGYGPKALDRILRLQRFLTLAITTDEALAGLAVLAGYADQAHLARETRTLAGATALELVAARRPRPTGAPGVDRA